MIYITLQDIRQKPLVDKILQAEWTDDDIERSINEAEAYIEANLIKVGYSREQLIRSLLVKNLVIKYTWYVILRDIYTMQSPSVGSGQEYNKWRDDVDKILENIKNFSIALIDENGNVMIPQKSIYDIRTTTKDVKRAVHMGKDWEWAIDDKYSKEEITNIERL